MEKLKYVNVSVVKSNIKSKKGVYFGRVCKAGRVNDRHLLHELKKRIKGMEIDIFMLEAVMKRMKDVVFDFLASGYNVDFFDMGTFSLETSGQLKVEGVISNYDSNLHDALSEINADGESNKSCPNNDMVQKEKVVTKCGDYDVSEKLNNNVQFKMKFSPSNKMKESLKNVKMQLAVKKKRAPVIKEIKTPIVQSSPFSPIFLKIKGDGLKVVGDSDKIGIYIGNDCDCLKKIGKTQIIQNTPKTLLFMVEGGLKQGVKYNIKIVTQYVLGGSSALLRVGEGSFIHESSASINEAIILDVQVQSFDAKPDIRLEKENREDVA